MKLLQLWVCLLLAWPSLVFSNERPNIVVIVADDLGNGDVGFNGLRDFKTPNLDALANSGIVFRNGYACHPFCAPSRAGLLTGKYQHRFGFEGNPSRNTPEEGLPPSEVTLADVLLKAGYDTAGIGKWHLGEQAEHHPLRRGFASYFGFLEGARSYFKTKDLRWQSQGTNGPRKISRPHPSSRVEYLTDLLTDEAIQFIRTERQEPYFLYLAYTAPHSPMEATEAWLDRVSGIEDPARRTYAAMVTAMDDGIGRVRQAIDSSGQANNTLVFFMSDNGGIPPVNSASNAPFRGMKGTLLEGGIRVPMCISWPGKIPAKGDFLHSVMGFDIFATSLAAAGLQPRPNCDSRNLLPYLSGAIPGPVHKTLYWRCGNGFQLAARRGNQKYLHVDGLPPRLFNLKEDPQELQTAFRENSPLRELADAWSDSLPVAEFTALGTKLDEQRTALGLPPRNESDGGPSQSGTQPD